MHWRRSCTPRRSDSAPRARDALSEARPTVRVFWMFDFFPCGLERALLQVVEVVDDAVVASLREPALGAVRYGVMVGVMALVCLCAAALSLLRRARAQHAH
jgi:hypothetical protein